MTLADDCRRLAAEMQRAADVVAESGAHVEIVDGNRAIADTLTRAATELDDLRAELLEAWTKIGDVRGHLRAALRDGLGDAVRKAVRDVFVLEPTEPEEAASGQVDGGGA